MTNIPSLYKDYKNEFTSREWCKICKFETYVSKYHLQDEMDFDEMLQQKRDVYNELIVTKKITRQMLKCSKQLIRERQLRQHSFFNKSTPIVAAVKHSPTFLDDDICSELHEEFQNTIEKVVSVDHKDTEIHNSINLFLFVPDELIVNQFILDKVIHRVKTFLCRKHVLNLNHVFFVHSGSVTEYEDSYVVSRFKLRDDMLSGKFKHETIYAKLVASQEAEIQELESVIECKRCYGFKSHVPFNLENFNIFREWQLDVPLNIQILLECFLNQRTALKSENKEDTIAKKLKKLYTVLDVLLNTFNKNYVGIFQELHTTDLAMNYSSINSVFNVTGATGTTTSLMTAEKNVKL